MTFRSKKALFASLKDQIWKRIHRWNEKTLSEAGKVILIQSVVQAIPSYAMSCFRLPKTLLKESQSIATNFFWHDRDRRRIHWIAWDKLCSSKLDRESGMWRVETINALLCPVDREAILQIPFNLSGDPDLLIWHYSNDGIFSVRSAYDLALSLSLASTAGTSNGRCCSKKLWKSIWQAKVPNKVKVFTWRAIHNALPTAVNLRRKLPHEEIVCPFCTGTDETIIHTLLHCYFARWGLKMLNKGFLFPQQIVDLAISYLNAVVVQNFGQFSPPPAHNHFWQAPHGNCIKINFDGALLEGGRFLGLKVVARNSLNLFGMVLIPP
ncbi:putative mitochondrial protein [Sesamum angolense]|uniref:Mitochondrial protein n=1 Tax=Sesamum angolense TaxID=2727404 RepID=A0AAE1WYL3_9LAMI|nr:putative mitochondrial protein [Sesamum angolense]